MTPRLASLWTGETCPAAVEGMSPPWRLLLWSAPVLALLTTATLTTIASCVDLTACTNSTASARAGRRLLQPPRRQLVLLPRPRPDNTPITPKALTTKFGYLNLVIVNLNALKLRNGEEGLELLPQTDGGGLPAAVPIAVPGLHGGSLHHRSVAASNIPPSFPDSWSPHLFYVMSCRTGSRCFLASIPEARLHPVCRVQRNLHQHREQHHQ